MQEESKYRKPAIPWVIVPTAANGSWFKDAEGNMVGRSIDCDFEQGKYNAELIIHIANTYDDLVAQLELVTNLLDFWAGKHETSMVEYSRGLVENARKI